MSYSGDAAEQVVRMSLNGIEIAARISGKAAERLATLLYAILKDQKRTKGKVRLTNMLRSGKELKVFAVKDSDLARFSKAAKQYGVLYCALKDRKAQDGLTDVMVRAEDASKINRIFERFSLATIDMASVKTEIEKSREEASRDDIGNGGREQTEISPDGVSLEGEVKTDEAQPAPERTTRYEERVNEFVNGMFPEGKGAKEEGKDENPSQARTERSNQSEASSRKKEAKETDGLADPGEPGKRKSVRKELEDIKKEMREPKKKVQQKQKENVHKAPKKKKRKEVR